MSKPGVIILTGYGINCEEETAHVFSEAGAAVRIWHINDLIENKNILKENQIFVFPGGFSYGDDTGSGKALATKIINNLSEEFMSFMKRDVLIMGICNGFQVMTNLGIVPGYGDFGHSEVALDHNSKNRYECRWVHLKLNNKIYFKDMDVIKVPVAHGEGNFYADEKVINKLIENDQIAAYYCDENGKMANGVFPLNPNGALRDIASITDRTGRFIGMMPHPERNFLFSQRDDYAYQKEVILRKGGTLPEFSEGMKIFRNAVNYFK
ncbi:MAG: phosphoribosylformylglycinamidine synthase I [Spirochaetes bacterium]|nr:phosphoribosylformylglycinamidine synthase I [Spirochaetota bacterium]